jgi:geranylgeranyl reductase family protein
MSSQGEIDLIVIGGGPAGTMAAYHAVQAGLEVLIVDKSNFPRLKPCGGGIATKAMALLPFSIEEVLETATGMLNVGLHYDAPHEFTTNGFICAFVVREKFDEFMLMKTLEAGANFLKIDSLDAVKETDDKVCVTIDGDAQIQAKYMIAADGANSQVRRLVKPRLDFSRGFALEGLVPYTRLSQNPKMEFDFGCVDYGYGWMFPKGDHVNVGIYTCNSDVSISKAELREYSQKKLGTDEIDDIVGFPLGFGGNTYQQTTERVLFAGDAAGFCEPMFGEGIHNALKSGTFAGKAVAGAVSANRKIGERYNEMLRDIRQDMLRCNYAAYQYFYPHVDGKGFKTLTSPISKMIFLKGFAGGKTLNEIMNGFYKMPFQKPIYPASYNKFRDKTNVMPWVSE